MRSLAKKLAAQAGSGALRLITYFLLLITFTFTLTGVLMAWERPVEQRKIGTLSHVHMLIMLRTW